MIFEDTKFLFKLYPRPIAAMSDIIDKGHWLYGAAAVVIVSAMLYFTVAVFMRSNYEAVQIKFRHPAVPGRTAPQRIAPGQSTALPDEEGGGNYKNEDEEIEYRQ